MLLAQHVSTKNDINGNPRRLWLVYNVDPETSGGRYGISIKAVYEEGYGGKPDRISRVRELWDIQVTPGEYSRLKRQAKTKNVFHYGS